MTTYKTNHQPMLNMNLVEPKKIHIVEDQPITTLAIRKILEDLGYQIAGISTNYEESLAILRKGKPDLILIDIYLQGKKTGIDLAHKINADFKVPFIFITSHADQITIQSAKTTKPFGYIVKPFESKAIFASIEMALSLADTEENDILFIPDGKYKIRVSVGDLLYAQADGNYTTFITTQKKIILRKGLKEVSETILNHRKFVRIHKSYLVNTDAITSRNGSFIFLRNGDFIPLGRTYASSF